MSALPPKADILIIRCVKESKRSYFKAKNAIGRSITGVGPQSKVTLMNCRSIFMWDGQTGDSPCARVFLQPVF